MYVKNIYYIYVFSERTGLHSRMFSSCSLSDLDVALSIDVASCLKKDNTQVGTDICLDNQK